MQVSVFELLFLSLSFFEAALFSFLSEILFDLLMLLDAR